MKYPEVKCIETKSRLVVAQGWREKIWGQNADMTANESGVSLGGDENF